MLLETQADFNLQFPLTTGKILCYLKIYFLFTWEIWIHCVLSWNMIFFFLRMFLYINLICKDSGFKGEESKFVFLPGRIKGFFFTFQELFSQKYSHCLQSWKCCLTLGLVWRCLHLKSEILFFVSKGSAWDQQSESTRMEHEGDANLFKLLPDYFRV